MGALNGCVRSLAAAVVALGMVSCASSPVPQRTEAQDDPAWAGSYSARIPAEDFMGEPAAPPEVLKGRWSLTLGPEYSLEQRNFGTVTGTLQVQRSEMVFLDVPAPTGTFNCFMKKKRTTEEGDGLYTFRFIDERLILEPVEEPCPLREILLTRAWQRL